MSSAEIIDLLSELEKKLDDPEELARDCDRLLEKLQQNVPDEAGRTAHLPFLQPVLQFIDKGLKSENDSTVIPTIKVAAFVSYRKGICNTFTREAAQSLVLSICGLSMKTSNFKVCNFCTWYIAMQRFSAAQLPDASKRMLEAAVHACSGAFPSVGVRCEGLKAIARLQDQLPQQTLLSSALDTLSAGGGVSHRGWIQPIYTSLVSQSESVRAQAQSMTERSLGLIALMDSSAKHKLSSQAVNDLVKEGGGLHSLNQMVKESSKWGKDKEATVKGAVKAWGFLARILGGKLVKDGHINNFLKLMETAFVYQSLTVRAEAYRSWVSLALLFDGMNSTIAHPKRLALVLSPLTTALQNEEHALVRCAALEAWCHVAKMVAKGSQLERSFDLVFKSVLPLVLRDTDTCIRSNGQCILAMMFGEVRGRSDVMNGGFKLPHSMFPPGGMRSVVLKANLPFLLSLMEDPSDDTDTASAWIAALRWAAESASVENEEAEGGAIMEQVVRSLASCMAKLSTAAETAAVGSEDDVWKVVVEHCTAHERIAKMLLSVSTSMQNTQPRSTENSEHKIKLAPFLAAAVARAGRGHQRSLPSFRKLVELCRDGGQVRALQQLFEALGHDLDQDGNNNVLSFWCEAAASLAAFSDDLSRRSSLATPTRSKALSATLCSALVQLCKVRLACQSFAQQDATLDREWARLFSAFHALVSVRDDGGKHVAAGRVCELLLDSLGDSCSEVQAKQAAFVLKEALRTDLVDETLGSSKPLARYTNRRNLWERSLVSIGKLWAQWTGAALRGAQEGAVKVAVVKELISLIAGVVDSVSTASELKALAAVTGPLLQCMFKACCKEKRAQGDAEESGTATPACTQPARAEVKLHRHGAHGLADDTEAVWEHVCQAIVRCFSATQADRALLAALAPLFCDAFGSPNLVIKNKAVAAWNASLGKSLVALDYPEQLQSALAKLAKSVSISIPAAQLALMHDMPQRSPSPERVQSQDCGDSTQTQQIRSPARIAGFNQHARGSLLPGSARKGKSSQNSSPAVSPAKPSPRREPNTGSGVGSGYVQVTPSKRKLILTAHQKEARRTQHQQATVVAYTSLEDAESQMQLPEEYAALARGDSTMFPSSPEASQLQPPLELAHSALQEDERAQHTPLARQRVPHTPTGGGAQEGQGATPVTVGVHGKHKRAREEVEGEEMKAEDNFARLGKEARKGLGLA